MRPPNGSRATLLLMPLPFESLPQQIAPHPAQPGFERIAHREEGLERTLSSAQLAMIAIGGAIGTGLFLGSRFAIGFAGPSVLLSYGIGAVITLLLMGCLAEMTVAHPTAGSFGAWAEFYLSPLAGFLVRYAYWAGVVFAIGTEVSAVAVYMRFWFPAVPGILWIALFAALLLLVNGLSVHAFGSVEYLFSALKLFAIAAFLLLGTWLLLRAHSAAVGFANLTAQPGGFFPHGASGMWSAVLIALFSFFPIEMIAIAAGEAKDPQRAITRAFYSTMFRLAFFYLLTLTVILVIVPWTFLVSDTPSLSPFILAMQFSHIPYAPAILNAVLLIAALSAMNSQLYITSRMLFSLARAGDAPSALGRLSRRGVPVFALLASTAGIALAALLNAFYPDRAFFLMFAIACFGPMFTWMMIFLTHLAFRRVHGPPAGFSMWGFPATTLLGAVLMLAALLTTPFVPAFHPTLLYGLPFLGLLAIVHRVKRSKL